MAANLPKDRFEIDYSYCVLPLYIGSNYEHTHGDQNKLPYMRKPGTNLIEFELASFIEITDGVCGRKYGNPHYGSTLHWWR